MANFFLRNLKKRVFGEITRVFARDVRGNIGEFHFSNGFLAFFELVPQFSLFLSENLSVASLGYLQKSLRGNFLNFNFFRFYAHLSA